VAHSVHTPSMTWHVQHHLPYYDVDMVILSADHLLRKGWFTILPGSSG